MEADDHHDEIRDAYMIIKVRVMHSSFSFLSSSFHLREKYRFAYYSILFGRNKRSHPSFYFPFFLSYRSVVGVRTTIIMIRK